MPPKKKTTKQTIKTPVKKAKPEQKETMPEIPEIATPDLNASDMEPPSLEKTPADQTLDTVTTDTEPVSVEHVVAVTPTEISPQSDIETPASQETENGDDDVFAEESSGGGKKLLLIFLIALVFGALIVGGYFYFMAQQKPVEEQAETTKQPEDSMMEEGQEATDQATMEENDESTDEEEAAELADYSIQILNGSGVAGQAGVVENLLTDAGFESFETGNASSFDYEETEVQMKESIPASVFEKIQESLPDYTVVEGDALDDDANHDIVITVGQTN